MGDVALCLPVLKAALLLNPKLEITFVTRQEFVFLFREIPRLHTIGVNFNQEYKGILGLYKLSKMLKSIGTFDYICDLHQVMRTHILNFLFLGTKCFKLDKGRLEKKYF
jgi:ADP-heptose:LPS heptosyltransferase